MGERHTLEIKLPDGSTGKGWGFGDAIRRTREGEATDYDASPAIDSSDEFEAGLEGLILASVGQVSPDELEAALESAADELASAAE